MPIYDANTYTKTRVEMSYRTSYDIGTTNIICSNYWVDLNIYASNQFILMNGKLKFFAPTNGNDGRIFTGTATINYSVPNQNISDEGVNLGYSMLSYAIYANSLNTQMNSVGVKIYKNYIYIWGSFNWYSKFEYEIASIGGIYKYA